jgi:hypothetical protein
VRTAGWVDVDDVTHPLSGDVVVPSWALHALGGMKAFNEEQMHKGEAAISVWWYATSSQLWFGSMHKWRRIRLCLSDFRFVDLRVQKGSA